MSPPALSEVLVFDSDVLIDYLRDQPLAVAFLEGTEQTLAISAITIAELYAGVRDGEERQQLDSFVTAFTVLPLDGQPAQRQRRPSARAAPAQREAARARPRAAASLRPPTATAHSRRRRRAAPRSANLP